MNRLKYPQKFFLVGLVLLIPTGVLLSQYLSTINFDINFARREQIGLRYNAALVPVLQGAQQHALFSQLVLAGRGEEYADDLAQVRDEMRERMQTLADTNAALSAELRLTDEFTQLSAEWQLLVSRSGGAALDDNRTAHLVFEEHILDLITIVGNNSNLILDPDIDSYYLMDTVITKLPQILATLSQLQVIGSEAILNGLPADERLRMVLLSETALNLIDANETGFEFAYAVNPALDVNLRPQMEDKFSLARAFLLATVQFENRSGSVFQFHSQTTSIKDGLFALYTDTAYRLDELLNARVSRFETQRNLVLLVSFVALLVSVYLFIAFYLAVRQTIDQLRQASEIMVSGKAGKDVHLNTRDELAEVVTAFNNVATEMVNARDRALQASRLKDEFLSTMSHELRTPLTAIIGYSGILLTGMRGQIDDVAKGMVGRIRESSNGLLSLINDILDIAKIEAGRLEIVEQPYELREFIDNIDAQMSVLARQKGIDLKISMADELPETLYGDTDKLGQILKNLLSNAIKFTEKGSVELAVMSSSQSLRMEVRDTGIGIPPQALDYIFDEFRQVDGSTRRVYGGTGLGLAIVRKLCLAMGGRVQVQSKQGVGSTFTVILPLHTEASQTPVLIRSAEND